MNEKKMKLLRKASKQTGLGVKYLKEKYLEMNSKERAQIRRIEIMRKAPDEGRKQV